jgi:hypothetical protein
MKALKLLLIAGILLLAGCATQRERIVTTASSVRQFTVDDAKTLSGIIDEYWAAWEPQRISERGLVEISDRVFDQGPDFSMVVDARYYPSWAVRSPKIPGFVPKTKAEDKEGAHKTFEDRILPLAHDAAAVTRVYRYTFTEISGRHGHHDSAATFVFRRSSGEWRIVQYHGSHGPRVYEP